MSAKEALERKFKELGYTHVEISETDKPGVFDAKLDPAHLRTERGDWPATEGLQESQIVLNNVYEFAGMLILRGILYAAGEALKKREPKKTQEAGG